MFENSILKHNNSNNIILWISKHVAISQGRRLSTDPDHFNATKRIFVFEILNFLDFFCRKLGRIDFRKKILIYFLSQDNFIFGTKYLGNVTHRKFPAS